MSSLKLHIDATLRYDVTPGTAAASPELNSAFALAPAPAHRSRTRGSELTTLVTSSKFLLTHPERAGIFSLGLHAACAQQPTLIKSKSNSAPWRMSVNQPLGYRASLRRSLCADFNYKWVFLAAASGVSSPARLKLGLRYVSVFALDHHNYALFEFWPGLDLEFRRGRGL